MALTKVTFFFEQGKWGWSETLYNSATQTSVALTSARALVGPRRNLLAKESQLTAIRASLDDPQRDSLFYSVPNADGFGLQGLGNSDIPNTCLVMRMEATDQHRRSYPLRGIPDEMVTNGGVWKPDAPYIAAINAYRAALINTTWGIAGNTGLAPTLLIVDSVQDFLNGRVGFTTNVDHNFNDNDLVYIGGRSPLKGFNGHWRVLKSVTDTKVFYIRTRTQATPFWVGLTVRKIQKAFVAFTNLIPERTSHRVTGRPFGAPRGKQSARLRL
jgi:hypothetical protein